MEELRSKIIGIAVQSKENGESRSGLVIAPENKVWNQIARDHWLKLCGECPLFKQSCTGMISETSVARLPVLGMVWGNMEKFMDSKWLDENVGKPSKCNVPSFEDDWAFKVFFG